MTRLVRDIDDIFNELNFEELPSPSEAEESDPEQGSDWIADDLVAEHLGGYSRSGTPLFPGRAKNAPIPSPRLVAAMALEQDLHSQPSATWKYNEDGTLRKPPEFLSQLALKRGAPMRGKPREIDLNQKGVMANLLSHRPNLKHFHKQDTTVLRDSLHWYDDLDGPTGMSVTPVLDVDRLMQYVDKDAWRRTFIEYLQQRKSSRTWRALHATSLHPELTQTMKGKSFSERARTASEKPEAVKPEVPAPMPRSKAKRIAREVRMKLRTNAQRSRVQRTEGALVEHLRQIRPATAPPRGSDLNRAPTTDWDRVLGKDGPDDVVPHHVGWSLDMPLWKHATKLLNHVNAADLRAEMIDASDFKNLDTGRRMDSREPGESEAITRPDRQKNKERAANLGVLQRPSTAPAIAKRFTPGMAPGAPQTKGGNDAVTLELHRLQGHQPRKMTYHHKQLLFVDGSMLADNESSAERWTNKVEQEVQQIVTRLKRLQIVYEEGKKQPHLAQVYQTKEACEDVCNGTKALVHPAHTGSAQGTGSASSSAALYTPGIRSDEIKMSHQTISDTQVAALVMLMVKKKWRDVAKHLKSLDLDGNGLTDRQFIMFMKGIGGLPKFERVRLARNKLTSKSIAVLTDYITENLAKEVLLLSLSNNPIGSLAAKDLFECLHRTKLRRLYLSSCDLDQSCASGLAFLLDNSLILEAVDLSWNRFGPEGCKTLADSLRYNQSVVSIDISYNALGPDGGAYIGEVLYDNRTLRHVNLSGNRISVQSCTVLAAGMRATRALNNLILDNNPVGLEGAAAMIECMARQYVHVISMQNCNFTKAANDKSKATHVFFDIQRPNKVYQLDLESAAQYAVVATLIRYWKGDGHKSWKRATLDGKKVADGKSVQPFVLTESMDWPARMPREGVLEIDFQTSRQVADKKIPVTDEQFDYLYTPILASDVSDMFRATFCNVMSNSLYLTAQQAIKAIAGISSLMEQVRASLALLGSLEDPFNLPLVIDSLKPEVQLHVMSAVGMLRGFSPANPTGSYLLNLSQVVEYAVAFRLLMCWGVEIRIGVCKPNEYEACWRNVSLNGKFLDPFLMDPLLFDLPRDGMLKLDYVSYDVPNIQHANLREKKGPTRRSKAKGGRKQSGKPSRASEATSQSAAQRKRKSPITNAPAEGGRPSEVQQSCATAVQQLEGGQDALSPSLKRLISVKPPALSFAEVTVKVLLDKHLSELDVEARETRCAFRRLADDAATPRKTAESMARKAEAALDIRANLNFSQLGHNRITQMTTFHLETLLSILLLPQMMSSRRAEQLFRDITSGTVSTEAQIKDILLPYTEQAAPKHASVIFGSFDADTVAATAETVGMNERGNQQLDSETKGEATSTPGEAGQSGRKEASSAQKGKKKGKNGADAMDWPDFPPGPKMGIETWNVGKALELLRVLAVDYHVTAQQVDLISEVFDDAKDKVRVIQMFWARVVNRSKLPHLLRSVPRETQIAVGHKLGWKTIMSLNSPDAAYELNLTRPDDNEVGAKLFRAAVDIRGRCVNNLLIEGKPHVIKEENYLLYGVVEEKALKTKGKRITFDFWSIRRNVLHNKYTNAACVLQSVWRAYTERKRRATKKLEREKRVAAKQAALAEAEAFKSFSRLQFESEVADGETGEATDALQPAGASLLLTRAPST